MKKLTDKLDNVFSQYIRQKYSENGIVRCYTCGTYAPITKMQCGHFQSRRYYSIRWDENNARVQCIRCNIFDQGRQDIFGQRLREEIGNEAVEKLLIKKNNTFKLEKFTLEYLIKEFNQKLTKL